jgi:hypothetical protein
MAEEENNIDRKMLSIKEHLSQPLTDAEYAALKAADAMLPLSVIYKMILQLDDMLKKMKANPATKPDTLKFYDSLLAIMIRCADTDRLIDYFKKNYFEAKELGRYFMERARDLELQLDELNALELAEARLTIDIIAQAQRKKIDEIKMLRKLEG